MTWLRYGNINDSKRMPYRPKLRREVMYFNDMPHQAGVNTITLVHTTDCDNSKRQTIQLTLNFNPDTQPFSTCSILLSVNEDESIYDCVLKTPTRELSKTTYTGISRDRLAKNIITLVKNLMRKCEPHQVSHAPLAGIADELKAIVKSDFTLQFQHRIAAIPENADQAPYAIDLAHTPHQTTAQVIDQLSRGQTVDSQGLTRAVATETPGSIELEFTQQFRATLLMQACSNYLLGYDTNILLIAALLFYHANPFLRSHTSWFRHSASWLSPFDLAKSTGNHRLLQLFETAVITRMRPTKPIKMPGTQLTLGHMEKHQHTIVSVYQCPELEIQTEFLPLRQMNRYQAADFKHLFKQAFQLNVASEKLDNILENKIKDARQQCFIELIYVQGRAIGFVTSKLFPVEHQGTKQFIAVTDAIYLDSNYRRGKLMSFISFRLLLALQVLQPNADLYGFYLSIHVNSLRLVESTTTHPDMKYWPKDKTSFTPGLVAALAQQHYLGGMDPDFTHAESQVTVADNYSVKTSPQQCEAAASLENMDSSTVGYQEIVFYFFWLNSRTLFCNDNKAVPILIQAAELVKHLQRKAHDTGFELNTYAKQTAEMCHDVLADEPALQHFFG